MSYKEMLENFPQPKILSKYVCESCEQIVKVTELAIAGGPDQGKIEKFYIGCRCADSMLFLEAERKDKLVRLKQLEDNFNNKSLVNKALQQATFDNYFPTNDEMAVAKDYLQKYVESFNTEEHQNVLLTGSFGTGKSHLSYAASKALIEKGFSCLFLSTPKLLTLVKNTYNNSTKMTENDLLELVQDIDLLVLDDLGAEYTNLKNGEDNWVWSKLFEVIDSRAGKSTIYTTNLSSPELEAKINSRNFSRIMEGTKPLRMNGKDYRKKTF